MRQSEKLNLTTQEFQKYNLWKQIRPKIHDSGLSDAQKQGKQSKKEAAKASANDSDLRILSQNASRNYPFFGGIAENLAVTKTLLDLQLTDQKLTIPVWTKLGSSLGKNQSVKSLTIKCCNLNQGKAMQVLMNGFKFNESVQKLDLSDNELHDE